MNRSEPLLEAINLGKRFGDVNALSSVSLTLQRGQFHALLGENGAGKSTLVKCIMGFYRPDTGSILYNSKEQNISSPEMAAALGIGMVYQHFTLIPNMTVAENIVLARPTLPFRINWKQEIEQLESKMLEMPFALDLHKNVNHLSAGEKQKVEIVKQLLLDIRVLFLDEPTSVLTPQEADEVLGKIHALTREKGLTVLMISHKFREVMQFADEATVLRKGAYIGKRRVAETDPRELAEMMVGSKIESKPAQRLPLKDNSPRLKIEGLRVVDDLGAIAISDVGLRVAAGEIVGIAGVSGNGQREFVQALAGQRGIERGSVSIDGIEFKPTRKLMRECEFYCLPEEPLRNAGVATLTIAENIALRSFDQAPFSWKGVWLHHQRIVRHAAKKIAEFKVRTSGPNQLLGDLSGGNVQRVILARELAHGVKVLIVSNPCFGLDFKAVAEIRERIMHARNAGAAVLLFSEDLDEILELADRIMVISSGQLVFETAVETAELHTIGRHMAGHH